jgi:2-iminobutanoate/2-iminopropanoate deaminase
MKRQITTLNAPSPAGAYSQAIVTKSNNIYVSSQMPLNPVTKIIPKSIEEQTAQILDNIKNILLEADSELNDIVRITVYLTDKNNFKHFNNVYRTFFREPYPARTVVMCKLDDDLLIEMDAIAEK